MKRALPIAVKFLHKGNRELSRNMAPYLSLAAIDNADLLSKHIQLIIDSIISGRFFYNLSLSLSMMLTLKAWHVLFFKLFNGKSSLLKVKNSCKFFYLVDKLSDIMKVDVLFTYFDYSRHKDSQA